jgi:hypothetical protein
VLIKIWVHGSSIAGKTNLLFTIFVVFKGVHAFASEGRLRFEGQKKSRMYGIQSLGAFITTTSHQKK